VRRAGYRALFGTCLDAKWVDEVRAGLQTGTPLGNDRFREQIEQALDRKVGNAQRGRPRGPAAEDSAAPAGQLGIAGL
jgi:putative transposase